MRTMTVLAKLTLLSALFAGCAEQTDEPAEDEAPPLITESTGELSAQLCAGPFGLTCSKGQYCSAREPGQCPGRAAYGVCAARPTVCTQLYAPVCGCDGTTYSNSCFAAAAGVAVASRGRCEARCSDDADCGRAAYCHFPDGQCGGVGSCQARSRICPFIYKPVCGCDGKTYGNACTASAAGVSIAQQGACAPQGPFCGGIAGIPCETGTCVDDPSDDCDPKQGGADCGGICVP